MKYNRDEEDIENSDQSTQQVVDPVNSYILNKNYTNRIKKSKLERMRAIIERQKNQKRIEKLLKEKEEEKAKENEKIVEAKLNAMIKDIKNEETNTEEIVKVDDEDVTKEELVKVSDEEEVVESDDGEEVGEDEEDAEDAEDDDDVYEDDDLEMEYEEEEDDDFEDCELDPDSWFLGLDSDDEPTEEDQTLFEAYKNSQKNCEILKPIKEKKDFLNKKRNLERNDNDNNNLKANNNLDAAIEKKEKNTVTTADKRKNSVTSNSSRDGNKKKKKVTFKFARNEFNGKMNFYIFLEYDQMKPINLSSNSKNQNQSKDRTQIKGLLKCRNKNRK
jgi:hypothetical protein